MPHNNDKINYGIDAPGVIRNLFIGGAILAGIAVFFPLVHIGNVNIDTRGLVWSGLGCSLGGVLMLVYSLHGKYKHRDRMLSLLDWKGAEQVLDIGTGKGLLMIGAAKKLSSGNATGIDIWNADDLTGNNEANALVNARLEGVAGKVNILNENVMHMSFADATFDVVLTNMCLHNIYNTPGRLKACEEIKRVLKPGGVGVISDYKHISEYLRNFKELGLTTEKMPTSWFSTFPPVAIIKITKL